MNINGLLESEQDIQLETLDANFLVVRDAEPNPKVQDLQTNIRCEPPDIRVVNNHTMVEYEGRGLLGLTHSEKLNKMHMSTDINESEVVE